MHIQALPFLHPSHPGRIQSKPLLAKWESDRQTSRSILADARAEVAGVQSPDLYEPSLRQRLHWKVESILSKESEQGPWSARDGMCLDLAAKWQQRLQAEGFQASIVAVDPTMTGDALSVEGRRVPGKFHAFVAVHGEGEPILVDGSMQQFFDGPEVRPDLPEVFIGTVSEAAELFGQHRQDLRIEVVNDPHIGRYDPKSLADFVYGAGPFAGSRTLLN